ncbi:MBL fold metallo-hydrolase [Synechococcus sp. PCC 7336]|uniref:MBL fold metallo-hydrolase n=1 Tax=Synechococcus sp. PCC 7336 TaxID=195250 RepID=UPI0003496355|nr:MBL fold metallo-hydrolase [Synechococcus sp. PCC 7336]
MFHIKQTVLAGLVLGAFGGALLSAAVAQESEEPVRIRTQTLNENLYMLQGGGGNMAVLAGEDGVFLIDDDIAPLTEQVIAAIGEISDLPIRFVINTHWHFDHTGGNEALGEAGALIVAHDNVRERMSVDAVVESLGLNFPASPEVALPVVTFNDTVTFHLNGESVRVFHVETAHTDGDAIVHFPDADAVHMGDVYFNGRYPFIDVESGGSIDGTIAAVELLLEKVDDDTQIIPGHGPLSNKAELAAYRDMLMVVRARTARAIAGGLTMEEFVASEPTADLDADWGKGFLTPEQFQQIVYTDLSQ